MDGLLDKAAAFFQKRADEAGKTATSFLVAVHDHGGGMRTVVTNYWDIKNHEGPDEKVYVVPKVRIAEPVAWEDIPKAIYAAEKFLSYTLAPNNKCGSCTVCCRVPSLESNLVSKPAGAMCNHCDGSGCKIYFARPTECKKFSCLWLDSQSRNDVMGPELRPDRCGVMFAKNSTDNDAEIFEVHPDLNVYPDRNITNRDAIDFIDEQQRIGRKAKLITHYRKGEK